MSGTSGKQNMGYLEITERVVNGALTADGIQLSTVVAVTTANTDVVVFSKTIAVQEIGVIDYIELGLTAAFKAVSTATADLIWKWQIRPNSSGAWVDLHTAVTETNIGTTYVERTRQGYAFPATYPTILTVPFDIQLILQSNEQDEGSAYVKNSSYVRVIYK